MATAPKPITVLLSGPSNLMRSALRGLFSRDKRFRFVEGPSSEPPAIAHEWRPDLIVLGPGRGRDPDLHGIDALHDAAPASPVAVVATGFEPQSFMAAAQKGIYGYFLSDFADDGRALLDTLVPIARWHVASVDPITASRFQAAAGTAIRAHNLGEPAGEPTEREREVLRLAAQGLNDQQIADRLNLQLRTVEHHFAEARERLGATTRFHLACLAKDFGLL